MYFEQLMNAVAWEKPDPPPNALHTAFTHLNAVEATQFPSSRGSRTTPMSTPVDEGDLFMSHPRSPAKTCSNFSRLPLTWSGVAFP